MSNHLKEVFAKGNKKWIKWGAIGAGIIVVGLITFFTVKSVTTSKPIDVDPRAIVKAEMGDIDVVLSGSGTIEPFSRYDIIPLVKGNIISSPPEEGDMVAKDALLYKIDDTDMRLNIDKTINAMEKAKLVSDTNVSNAGKLRIYAPADGKLINFSLKKGDFIAGGGMKIGEIINDTMLKVKVPFTKTQIESIYPGQQAELTSALHMARFTGQVSSISNTAIRSSSDGSVLYDVEIAFTNPGSITKGVVLTATIGGLSSPSQGTVENAAEVNLIAEGSGKVITLGYEQNEYVRAGTLIAELENETISSALKKSEMDYKDLVYSLEQQQRQLKDYSMLSPIQGKVIKKTSKVGDTVNFVNTNVVLMTVADMSKFKFFIDVDELDIILVKLGQTVSITSDAVNDATFSGTITNIATEGKTQNGVTTYPVEVTIDKTGQLMPGMNVDAKIVVERKQNVLRVPINSVKKTGATSTVIVKDTGSTKQKQPKSVGSATKLPDGYVAREVEVGIENKDYIEILSGLSQGDELIDQTAYSSTTKSGSGTTGPMGGPPGGGAHQ